MTEQSKATSTGQIFTVTIGTGMMSALSDVSTTSLIVSHVDERPHETHTNTVERHQINSKREGNGKNYDERVRNCTITAKETIH